MPSQGIGEWIIKAENGESVWLPVLREAFAKDPSAARWVVRLKGSHYGVREYEIFMCFLQSPFGESCRIKMEIVATPKWRKLQDPADTALCLIRRPGATAHCPMGSAARAKRDLFCRNRNGQSIPAGSSLQTIQWLHNKPWERFIR